MEIEFNGCYLKSFWYHKSAFRFYQSFITSCIWFFFQLFSITLGNLNATIDGNIIFLKIINTGKTLFNHLKCNNEPSAKQISYAENLNYEKFSFNFDFNAKIFDLKNGRPISNACVQELWFVRFFFFFKRLINNFIL